METKNKLSLWCPVTKDINSGEMVGILSDTSLDRDMEFMDKSLLQQWAKSGVLPALANHTNKMENFIGGWTDLKVVEKEGHTALVAKPFFFKSNPMAQQIKGMVEEALAKGLNPGISIGAIPKAQEERKIEGKSFTVHTEAELVEATWVPIQSNRNAFAAIARSFDINMDGKEETKMDKELEKVEEEVQNVPDEQAPEEEAKVEEPVAEEEPAVEEEPKAEEPVVAPEKSATELELQKLKKELEELKKKAVLKATVEPKVVEKELEPTLSNVLIKQFGGK
jgi:hypothetical protein